jgi:hypothetical protein
MPPARPIAHPPEEAEHDRELEGGGLDDEGPGMGTEPDLEDDALDDEVSSDEDSLESEDW